MIARHKMIYKNIIRIIRIGRSNIDCLISSFQLYSINIYRFKSIITNKLTRYNNQIIYVYTRKIKMEHTVIFTRQNKSIHFQISYLLRRSIDPRTVLFPPISTGPLPHKEMPSPGNDDSSLQRRSR